MSSVRSQASQHPAPPNSPLGDLASPARISGIPNCSTLLHNLDLELPFVASMGVNPPASPFSLTILLEIEEERLYYGDYGLPRETTKTLYSEKSGPIDFGQPAGAVEIVDLANHQR